MNEVISHEDHFWIGLNDVAQEGGPMAQGIVSSFRLNPCFRPVHVGRESPGARVLQLELRRA